MFRTVLRYLQPDLILDVGSRNGNDSQSFRHASPNSEIVAFEANPELYDRMTKNQKLHELNIQVQPYAISNSDGEAQFTVFNETRGTGSLKSHTASKGTTYTVPTRALDGLFPHQSHKRVAMWIDVEGHSQEVLDGAKMILKSTDALHIELEDAQIFEGQVLAPQVIQFLETLGFFHISGGIYPGKRQGDMLFVHQRIAKRISFLLFYNRVRFYHSVAHAAKRLNLNEHFPQTVRFWKKLLGGLLGTARSAPKDP
jgi:FkbM family methyltransferase